MLRMLVIFELYEIITRFNLKQPQILLGSEKVGTRQRVKDTSDFAGKLWLTANAFQYTLASLILIGFRTVRG